MHKLFFNFFAKRNIIKIEFISVKSRWYSLSQCSYRQHGVLCFTMQTTR